MLRAPIRRAAVTAAGPAVLLAPGSPAIASAPASAIKYRPAAFGDCRELARLICVAGGGLYEFLLGDLIPFVSPASFLAIASAGRGHCISYRNCLVAVDDAAGGVIGAANVFPADLLRKEDDALLPAKRRTHVRPMLDLQDWGSMFLNALAVKDGHRRRGVGARLLGWAEAQARRAGFDRLSLHAWADNTTALEFYKARGFVALAVADIPYDPRLPHAGGSILMHRRLG
jgi:GNAT superfamily N-acetyltransferase